MAYIDLAFYQAFTTTSVDLDEFSVLAQRASDMVDEMTMHKIVAGGGFAALPAFVQEQVKKAVAVQVEFLAENGGLTALAENGSAASASIGKFSYSLKQTAGGNLNGLPLSPMVMGYLRPTGLLFKGM